MKYSGRCIIFFFILWASPHLLLHIFVERSIITKSNITNLTNHNKETENTASRSSSIHNPTIRNFRHLNRDNNKK